MKPALKAQHSSFRFRNNQQTLCMVCYISAKSTSMLSNTAGCTAKDIVHSEIDQRLSRKMFALWNIQDSFRDFPSYDHISFVDSTGIIPRRYLQGSTMLTFKHQLCKQTRWVFCRESFLSRIEPAWNFWRCVWRFFTPLVSLCGTFLEIPCLCRLAAWSFALKFLFIFCRVRMERHCCLNRNAIQSQGISIGTTPS